MTNLQNTLLIFAKPPVAGEVKTRLSPPFTLEDAALLYRCMLLDTLSSTQNFEGVSRVICYAGDEDKERWFSEKAPDARITRQYGENLGVRMENAFEAAFADKRQPVAIIGSDMPHLPTAFIVEAFRLLRDEAYDLVLGPCDDGGYYLMAMKELHRELFCGINWSTDEVLSESLKKASEAKMKVALLPSSFDLDAVNDLRRFMSLPASDTAILTREFLQCWSL